MRVDRGLLRRPQRIGHALVIEGHAARVHGPSNPLRYAHGDEYRDVAELQRIVGQLAGKPVTMRHPDGLIMFGAAAQVVGRVDSAWIDGDHIAVRLRVDNAEAIADIESGTKELSLGYATTVGDDGFQRDTDVDHMAIVPTARCGGTCALRVDGAEAEACACRHQIDHRKSASEGVRMADDKEMSTDEQLRFLKAKTEELQLRVDSLDADAKTQKGRADSLEQQLDVAKNDLEGERARHKKAVELAEGEEIKKLIARADAAETDLAKFRESIPTLINARAELLVRARTVLGTKCRFDASAPDRTIEGAIIKHFEPTFRFDGLSDAQVKSRADALYESRMANAESLTRASEVLATPKGEARIDSKDVRAKAWREQATNPNAYRAVFGVGEEA